MTLLTNSNETIREIVSITERLDSKYRRLLLDNIRKFELKAKALEVNQSIRKGKKPSLAKIASIVRKVRKENAGS